MNWWTKGASLVICSIKNKYVLIFFSDESTWGGPRLAGHKTVPTSGPLSFTNLKPTDTKKHVYFNFWLVSAVYFSRYYFFPYQAAHRFLFSVRAQYLNIEDDWLLMLASSRRMFQFENNHKWRKKRKINVVWSCP